MEYRIIASSVYEPHYLERVIVSWYHRPAKQAIHLPAIGSTRPSIDAQLVGTRRTTTLFPTAKAASSHNQPKTGLIPLHTGNKPSGSVPISTQPAMLQTAGEFEIELGIRLAKVSSLGDLNRDYFFWQENMVLVVEPFSGQHRWVKLKKGWNNPQVANPEPVSLGRFAPDRAMTVPVNQMTSTEKLAEASRRAIPGIIKRGGEAVQEQVQALLDPETIAVMLALVGVSTVFPVVGLGLAIAGVYFLGADAIDVLKNLVDFVQKATTAQSEADLDAAAECLVTVVVVGGVVAWELLSRKKGKRRKLVKRQEPGGQITEPIAKPRLEETPVTPKKTKPKAKPEADPAKSETSATKSNSDLKTKKKSLRDQYLGRTPGKKSATGQEVIKRMRNETPPRIRERGGITEFKSRKDGKWYDIADADMAHYPQDAVEYWNKEGRNYGPKSKEVRDWMTDSDNYELEHFSHNRSDGAKLNKRYTPPTVTK